MACYACLLGKDRPVTHLVPLRLLLPAGADRRGRTAAAATAGRGGLGADMAVVVEDGPRYAGVGGRAIVEGDGTAGLATVRRAAYSIAGHGVEIEIVEGSWRGRAVKEKTGGEENAV